MDKVKFLEELTGHGKNYYIDCYEQTFYKHYEFLKSIKDALGPEAIEHLYYLDNEESAEFRAILKYLLSNN